MVMGLEPAKAGELLNSKTVQHQTMKANARRRSKFSINIPHPKYYLSLFLKTLLGDREKLFQALNTVNIA
jgi:hypothetical protein